MATYKGLPFNGAMDNPPGTGMQAPVETCKAIADWIIDASTPAVIKSADTNDSIRWNDRTLNDSSGAPALAWTARLLYDSDGTTATLDWNQFLLNDASGNAAVEWNSRQLLQTDGGTICFTWGQGVNMPNLPITDPGTAGAIWSNAGVLTLSAGP